MCRNRPQACSISVFEAGASANKHTHMPAALPAATPATASSNTRQQPGSAGGENALAALRKISGAGFPFFTWSPVFAKDSSSATADMRQVQGHCGCISAPRF